MTADAAPTLDGVTGEVDVITGTDGSTQVTLNGWPLYYYVGDAAAGDTTGQAVNDVWWVVGADGVKITRRNCRHPPRSSRNLRGIVSTPGGLG